MSTSATGNQRVDSVCSQLARLGYRCAPIKASGRRGAKRRRESGIDGDIVALAAPGSGRPHLLVEVGGKSKGVQSSIDEMTEGFLPKDFRVIVGRCINRKWRYNFEPRVGYPSLKIALDSLVDMC